MKKIEEVDGGSVRGPHVKSVLGDVIVSWHVPMEVVGSTSPEVSPFNTHGVDRKKYQILCKQSESMTSIQED